jgi:hypothetical protein
VDERERRLSHEEYAVALLLVAEGHTVRSLAERRGGARTADMEVCGQPVEVKSWLRLEDRDGVRPSARSVLNKLLDGSSQAPTVILYGYGSGLTADKARTGMRLFAARAEMGELRAARVLGDGFDLSWTPVRERSRAPAPGPSGWRQDRNIAARDTGLSP